MEDQRQDIVQQGERQDVGRQLAARENAEVPREESYLVTLERENRKLKKQLCQAQKMEVLGQLVDGVAHDFKNLLQVILGHCDLAQDLAANNDQLLDELHRLESATERCNELVSRLLAFSRQQPSEPQALDLNQQVRSLLLLLHCLVPSTIEVQLQASSSLPLLRADPGQLDQLMLNLCINARDAMSAGGSLTLTTREIRLNHEQRQRLSGEASKYWVEIAVSDTGCGIDPRLRRQIFEPFFTTKSENTGLGLATVASIVQQYGGLVELDSQPGAGTTLRILLPTENCRAPSIDELDPAQPIAGTETILLAEDEALVRTSVARVLRTAGYRVLEAADGREAVNLYQRHAEDIELLLLDALMPRLNGSEAYSRIRHLGARIPTLFTSGCSAELLPTEARGMPETHLLLKPYSRTSLLHRVRQTLDAPLQAG